MRQVVVGWSVVLTAHSMISKLPHETKLSPKLTDGDDVPLHILLHVLVRVHRLLARVDIRMHHLPHDLALERFRRGGNTGFLARADESFEIVGVLQVVEVEDGVVKRVGAANQHGAHGFRLQEAGSDGETEIGLAGLAERGDVGGSRDRARAEQMAGNKVELAVGALGVLAHARVEKSATLETTGGHRAGAGDEELGESFDRGQVPELVGGRLAVLDFPSHRDVD